MTPSDNPAARGVAWAERVLDEPVRDTVALKGGWTSVMLRLTLTSGQPVVLRLLDKQPWRRHAKALLERESEILEQLAGSAIPAPRSLAVDLDGAAAGTPAHLMSWLPGSLRLQRLDTDTVTRLARVLADIHAFSPGDSRPRDYQSWATPDKWRLPPWARRPELWRTAFGVLIDDPPRTDCVFLHRDFHLGNVLWSTGAVAGVVDWVETSWGPAELDVAHTRSYLAMLHGQPAAGAFSAAYAAAAQTSVDPAAQRYFDVMDVVGYLPSPEKVARPWRDMGVPLSDGQAQHRLEQHLTAVLATPRGV